MAGIAPVCIEMSRSTASSPFLQACSLARVKFIQYPNPEILASDNVLGKRAGHASELVRILPILPLIINYTTKLEDIGKKQVVLQTTELNTMSNFTTSTTP
jgi:hypothetical protein